MAPHAADGISRGMRPRDRGTDHVEERLSRCRVVYRWSGDRFESRHVVRATARRTPWTEAAHARGAAAGGGDAPATRPDEFHHHDGRAVALDQSLVGGQTEELAPCAVLLQRGARAHPAART